MSRLARIALALFAGDGASSGSICASNAPATISQELVPFSSDEVLARLARSTAKVNFPALANQCEPESNGAFVDPRLPPIVLNAV